MSKAQKSTSHVVAVSAGVVPAEVSRHVIAAIDALPPGVRLHVRPTAAHEGASSVIFLGREGLEAVADAASGILDAEGEVEDAEDTSAADGGAGPREPRRFTFQEGPLAGTRITMSPITFAPDCKITVSLAAADVPSDVPSAPPVEKQAPSLPPELERFRFLGSEWADRAAPPPGGIARLSYCRTNHHQEKAQRLVALRRDSRRDGSSAFVVRPWGLEMDEWRIGNQTCRAMAPGADTAAMVFDMLMFDATAITSKRDLQWLRGVAANHMRTGGPIIAFLPPLSAS